MVTLNPQIIKKNGKNEYAIIPYKQFLEVKEQLEDYEDLQCLREAKAAEGSEPTISLEEYKMRMTSKSDE